MAAGELRNWLVVEGSAHLSEVEGTSVRQINPDWHIVEVATDELQLVSGGLICPLG